MRGLLRVRPEGGSSAKGVRKNPVRFHLVGPTFGPPLKPRKGNALGDVGQLAVMQA